jgi:hypothetical protein
LGCVQRLLCGGDGPGGGGALGALAEPMVQTARELEEIAEGLEVEPELEAVEDCTEALRENWQRQLGRG